MRAKIRGRSKYGAVRTTIDGITFASKKEAKRYAELKLLEKAGEIRRLRLQPRYALCPLVIENADARDLNAGQPTVRRVPVANYVADFEYEARQRTYRYLPEWAVTIEDTKGMKTETYKLKKRWFEAQYGIQITEL